MVLSEQLIDLLLTSNGWFFHDKILLYCCTWSHHKAKTVGFLKTEVLVGAYSLVSAWCWRQNNEHSLTPTPKKKLIIRNQLHYGSTSGFMFCFGLVTGSYSDFTRFTIYILFSSLFSCPFSLRESYISYLPITISLSFIFHQQQD